MRFTGFLRDAASLLIKEPKLFIPKIIVSLLYSIIMLILGFLLVTHKSLIFLALDSRAASYAQLQELRFLIFSLLLLLFLSLVILIIDIIVSAMYPLLVDDFYKKRKLSLRQAFSAALNDSKRIVPPFFIIVILLLFPLPFLNSYLIKANSSTHSLAIALITLIIYFALLVLFYFLYPAVMLNKGPIRKCFSENFVLAKRNIGLVTKASFIPFVASLISITMAFLSAFEPLLITLFLIYRILIAVILTYNSVLSPSIYLGVKSV